jgi:hypothetical protein
MIIIYLSLALVGLFGISILLWMYVFSIYEIRYNPVYSNQTSNPKLLEIKCSPLNSFGRMAPFRNPQYYINVIKGNEFINNITIEQNRINISFIDFTNEDLVIEINSNLNLFPFRYVIN